MMNTAMLTRVIIPAVPHCEDSKPDVLHILGTCAYLDIADQATIIDNDGNSIDDDLHQKLNLKHPKKENAEEQWNTIRMVNNNIIHTRR